MTHAKSCADFDQWLDEGSNAVRLPAMRAHAAACCGQFANVTSPWPF